MELFDIVEYTAVPTAELYNIACFKTLLSGKYNDGPGDRQGRNRIRALKELNYLYHCYDFRSECVRNNVEEDRSSEACKAADIDFKTFKVSKELKACIKYFVEERMDKVPEIKVLNAIREVILKAEIYYKNVSFEVTTREEEYLDKQGNKKIKIVKTPPADINKVLTSIDNIEKSFEKVAKLEEYIKKKFADAGSVIQGGKQQGRLT